MSNIHTPNHDSVPGSNQGCIGCIEEAVATERERLRQIGSPADAIEDLYDPVEHRRDHALLASPVASEEEK